MACAVCTGGGAAPGPPSSPNDLIGVMIPSGNKPALVAYYCAIGALIPVLGIPLGIVAFVSGLKGLRLEREHPAVRGGLHAWFGILVGAFFTLVWIGLVIWLVVALMTTRMR